MKKLIPISELSPKLTAEQNQLIANFLDLGNSSKKHINENDKIEQEILLNKIVYLMAPKLIDSYVYDINNIEENNHIVDSLHTLYQHINSFINLIPLTNKSNECGTNHLLIFYKNLQATIIYMIRKYFIPIQIAYIDKLVSNFLPHWYFKTNFYTTLLTIENSESNDIIFQYDLPDAATNIFNYIFALMNPQLEQKIKQFKQELFSIKLDVKALKEQYPTLDFVNRTYYIDITIKNRWHSNKWLLVAKNQLNKINDLIEFLEQCIKQNNQENSKIALDNKCEQICQKLNINDKYNKPLVNLTNVFDPNIGSYGVDRFYNKIEYRHITAVIKEIHYMYDSKFAPLKQLIFNRYIFSICDTIEFDNVKYDLYIVRFCAKEKIFIALNGERIATRLQRRILSDYNYTSLIKGIQQKFTTAEQELSLLDLS